MVSQQAAVRLAIVATNYLHRQLKECAQKSYATHLVKLARVAWLTNVYLVTQMCTSSTVQPLPATPFLNRQ